MTSGGRFDFDDGGTYCGSWEDGKALGYGICTGPKGQGEFAGAYHNGFEISGVYKWTTGSTFKGQWTQGKRHGVGVENKGRWLYQGEWTQGFKGRYGVRQSMSTGAKYEGTWTTGLQDGYGVETYADGGTYQGQWLRGIRHGYGVRQSVPYGIATLSRQKAARESLTSLRSESEEDQIVKERDRRMEEIRGGFVLISKRSSSDVRQTGRRLDDSAANQRRSNSAEPTSSKSRAKASLRRAFDGLRLRKQRSEEFDNDAAFNGSPSSTGERRRYTSSSGSARSWLRRKNDDDSANKSTTSGSYASSLRHSPISALAESCASFAQDDNVDPNAVETYSGEWKNDKRSGFGVAERSDGLKYEGEWDNNKRHGYGAMTFQDGSREEGKFKSDVLVSSGRRNRLMILRANKMKEHVDNAIAAAQRASQIAVQKADIAINRMTTARAKAEQAVQAANKAQLDAEKARSKAIEYAPEFMAEVDKKNAAASAAAPLLGLPHLPKGSGPQHPYDMSHGGPMDAAASFVSQFTDHYNPQNQLQTAKSFLNRVTKAAAGAVESASGNEDLKSPLPSIGSALLSAGLESGLLKSLTPKPFPANLRQASLTPNNISKINPLNMSSRLSPLSNQEISAVRKHPSASSTPSQRTAASSDASTSSGKRKDRRRLQDMEISVTVPSQHSQVQKTNLNLSNAPPPSSSSFNAQDHDPRFSHLLNQTVLDDHFDQYQTQDEATMVNPTGKAPSQSQISNRVENPSGQPGSPYDLYQHQHQLQLQLQQQQQFIQQQLQQLQQNNPGRLSNERPFSYDNPRARHNQRQSEASAQSGQQYYNANPGNVESNRQSFGPSQVSYERRQTLPAGQLQAIAKGSTGPSRQEAPAVVRREVNTRSSKEAMGSMPDVSKRKTGKAKEEPVIPREEVHYMSMRRREELRKLREEEERRRQQELILSFGEFKNWCQQRQLLVLLIAINLGLAAMFFNLLSR